MNEELREKVAKRMVTYWISVVEGDERDRLYADLLGVASAILKEIEPLIRRDERERILKEAKP